MQPLGPQQQRCLARGTVAAFELQPARRFKLTRRGHPAIQKSAPSNKACDKAVRRALVEVALRADLADFAISHDDEAVCDGERLLLIVRDHDGGQSERSEEHTSELPS